MQYRLAVDACWAIFLVIWVVAALFSKKTIERPTGFNRFLRATTVIVMVLLLGYGAAPASAHAIVLPRGPGVLIFGIVLCGAGLAFTLWARYTIGRNWSGAVTFKQDHELVQRGPYALARHPIYTGVLAMVVGTVMVFGTLLALMAVPAAFITLWLKARQEEALLTKHFPDAYPLYRARVKALVPFVI